MSTRFLGSMIAMAAVEAVLSLAPVPAAGPTSPVSFVGVAEAFGEGDQAPTAAATTWDPPRTPDGQPDIQGIWAAGTAQSSYDIHEGQNGPETRVITGAPTGPSRSLIVDPADGKVPYQPWAAAKKKEIFDNHTNPKPEHLDPQARCFLDGVPRQNYQEMSGIQILQTPGYVVMLYEYTHAYRIIPLDGRPHVGENIRLWMGDSRGRWEGNTLVVGVTNNNDETWFDVVGDFHSDALHVIERWTFVTADTIHYEATIEDPTVFMRPWKIALTFARNRGEDYELLEHACYEGNRAVELMLRSSSTEKTGKENR